MFESVTCQLSEHGTGERRAAANHQQRLRKALHIFASVLGVITLLVMASGVFGEMQLTLNATWKASIWFFWSFLPLLVVALILAKSGEPAVSELTRNFILGCVGAVIGASIAIWAGYAFLGTTVNAQGTPSPNPPSVQQNNQNGPNFNVPGSGNQFNIYPKPPPIAADDAIYQAGVVVGKAFGGRRLPNDPTRFEFREITNCIRNRRLFAITGILRRLP